MQRALVAVLALLLAALIAIPASSRADRPSSAFGVNSHIASRFGNFDAMSLPADIVAASGAGWAREDFHWFFIEPEPGQRQWEYFDRAVDLLTERGVNIIGVLGHPPGWATPEPADDPSGLSFYAPDPQLFAQYAAAVVERYRGRIVHWEIWNEPDNKLFWQPAPDPVAYGQLLSATYLAISAVAPEANVLLGGINPFETGYLQRLADIGAWWAFDIVNIHPYVGPRPPEGDGGITTAIDNVRRIMAAAGEKPIWATEYGWNALPDESNALGMSEEDQADYMVRGALLLHAAGAERVLWYSLKDEAHNGYGLFRFNGAFDDLNQPRPGLSAFTNLNYQLGGAGFQRRLDELSSVNGVPVYGLRFVRGAETIDVLWAAAPTEALLPTAAAAADVANRNGDGWQVPAEAGALRLYPGPGPIYVRHVASG